LAQKVIAIFEAQLGNANEEGSRYGQRRLARRRTVGSLRPLQPDELRASGLPASLLIQDAQGAAASAGVQSGDLLLAVNGQVVSSVEQIALGCCQVAEVCRLVDSNAVKTGLSRSTSANPISASK
jgi:hypothetical protein